MWQTLIENPQSIRAIFNDETPSLDNLSMREVNIICGENLVCYLKFDLNELPSIMPDKWIKSKVNTIQINLALINSEVRFFELNGDTQMGKLTIESNGDEKIISYSSQEKILFVVKSRWLNVLSITGYENG